MQKSTEDALFHAAGLVLCPRSKLYTMVLDVARKHRLKMLTLLNHPPLNWLAAPIMKGMITQMNFNEADATDVRIVKELLMDERFTADLLDSKGVDSFINCARCGLRVDFWKPSETSARLRAVLLKVLPHYDVSMTVSKYHALLKLLTLDEKLGLLDASNYASFTSVACGVLCSTGSAAEVTQMLACVTKKLFSTTNASRNAKLTTDLVIVVL